MLWWAWAYIQHSMLPQRLTSSFLNPSFAPVACMLDFSKCLRLRCGSRRRQLQVPLLPNDASKLLDQLLRSELPAAYASLRKPAAAGSASAVVVMQTVAQLVTVAAVAHTLTRAAASELADVAWRSVRLACHSVKSRASGPTPPHLSKWPICS